MRVTMDYPVSLDMVMPTRLGNVLRAAEMYPTERYRIDTWVIWPRLYLLLPERSAVVVDTARERMELAAAFTVSLALAGATATGLLASYPCTLWIPAVLCVLSRLAYRGLPTREA